MARKKTKDDPSPKTNGDGPAKAPAQPPRTALEPSPIGARAGTQAELAVLAQYIKDLSFESPQAPQSLQGPGQNPQLKVSVNVNAAPGQGNRALIWRKLAAGELPCVSS